MKDESRILALERLNRNLQKEVKRLEKELKEAWDAAFEYRDQARKSEYTLDHMESNYDL